MLDQAIEQRAFPGAAVAITHQGKLVALKGVGAFTYDAGAPRVQPATIYDLASVSKVVATTTMAMILYQRGLLDLNAPAARFLPFLALDIGDRRWERVTAAMLLAHSAGLAAYSDFSRRPAPQDVITLAASIPLEADPGTATLYSDLGFILLGHMLEQIAGEPLHTFCALEIFGPLGMAQTGFRPPASLHEQIPPTVDDREFRMKVVQGEVHDPNAWIMHGVAGHAGVFAPAEDVARFAHAMLSGGAPILRPDTVELFTRRQASPAGTSRALGWDTPSQPSQSGTKFSPRSFGHLGYTGTSLWCDPDRRLSVTLLTNRTWPNASSQQIKQVRPTFHDAVVDCLA
ncbi:MAG TPA: serine hydrolase domain-containing protein [Terriglobales bacterium]|nr:serine hydrolase domain-containing protein [Terriglobales bacterium]